MTSPHPTDQSLAAFVDGLLPEAERSAVVRHVDGCEGCVERVAALAALAEAPAASAPASLIAKATRPPASRLARAAPYGAVAAGVLLAVALWPARDAGSPAGPAVPPAAAEAPQVRAAAPGTALIVEAPRDRDRLAPGFEIRWQGLAGAVFYEVQVTTADGDLLWSERVEASSPHAVVPTALSPSHPSYLWVTAHLPEGRRITSSVVRVQGR